MRFKILWLLKFGAASLIALAVWEVLLRVIVVSPTPYADNPPFGWMPRPKSRAMSAIEGRALTTYNEHGFRDSAIIPKSKDETRILCLGDSYTEGIQVAAPNTFASQLQSLLRRDGVASARVYNGGRSGPSVAYSVALAEEYRSLFAPDWVVILVRDQWTLMFSKAQEIRYRPQSDGFEIESRNYWNSVGRLTKIATNSGVRDLAIATYGKRQIDEMRAGPSLKQPDAAVEGGPNAHAATRENDLQTDEMAMRGTLNADANALRSRRAVEWTVAQLKAKYPRLILVLMPESSPQRAGLLPATPTENIFREMCAKEQIPLVDMRPIIQEDFARTHIPPFGFSNTLPWLGHPNEHGHALIARALAAKLRPLLDAR